LKLATVGGSQKKGGLVKGGLRSSPGKKKKRGRKAFFIPSWGIEKKSNLPKNFSRSFGSRGGLQSRGLLKKKNFKIGRDLNGLSVVEGL